MPRTATTIIAISSCGTLTTQRATLMATVAREIVGVANGNTSSSSISALTSNTKALGKAEGLMTACLTAPSTSPKTLVTQRAQAQSDLEFNEENLKKAALYKDWPLWLTLRTKLQNNYALVAKIDAWLTKLAADAAAAAQAAADAAKAAAQAQVDQAAKAAADAAAHDAQVAADAAAQVANDQASTSSTDVATVTHSAEGRIGPFSKRTALIGAGILVGFIAWRKWSSQHKG